MSKCLEASASFPRLVHKFPETSGGGIHLPYTPDGPYRFELPLAFAACSAASLGDAEDCRLEGPEKIAMKSHVKWGYASAQQLKRELVDSERNNMHLLTCVHEVCLACEKSPQLPAAGGSDVATFNEELQVDLLLFGDIIALHVMDVFSTCSALTPVHSKKGQEAWGVFPSLRIGIFGPPECILMDEGGKCENEAWTD